MNFATALLACLVTGAVGYWLQHNIAKNRQKFVEEYDLTPEQEAKLDKWKRVDVVITVFFFIVALVFMFVFATWMGGWHARRVQAMPGTIVSVAPLAPWFLAGITLGLVIVGALDYLRTRLIFRGQWYRIWVAYGDMHMGMSVVRVLAIAWVLAAAAVPITLFLAADNYVRVTDDSLVVNKYWSIGERVYPLTDITAIDASSYEVDGARHPVYRFTFRDGGVWWSEGLIKSPGVGKQYTEIVKAILERTDLGPSSEPEPGTESR